MSGVTSPKSSSDQFDALIELLATDDAADDSNFHIVPEGAASTGLRDANGKLDYTKIRSLFQQRQTSKNTEHASSSDPSFDPDPEIKLPEIVVEEPTALADISPPVKPEWVESSEIEIEMAPGEGSIPDSDAQVVLVPQVDPLFPCQNLSHFLTVKCAQDSEDSVVHNLEDALSKAYEEIAELRRQGLQLETQAAELFKPKSPKDPDPGDIRGYVSKPASPTLSNAFGTEPLVPPGVDRLDTEHAIQFLIRVDELVWRRSRYPNGPSAPVFSQDNVDAVTQRLMLWESIIRAPGPR
ncbi:hypothetical protein EDB85DRAFT_2246500 [Lactarius pseudohatsudake]|nr:hypothetical protein EDB85DRAFT_2246500 [Lactarius pseudohatsudake]